MALLGGLSRTLTWHHFHSMGERQGIMYFVLHMRGAPSSHGFRSGDEETLEKNLIDDVR